MKKHHGNPGLLLVGMAVLGCGTPTTDPAGADPASPAGPGSGPVTGYVSVQNSFFAPQVVEISVTGSVTWTNFGPSRHSTVSDAGLWNSGQLFPPAMGGSPSGSGDEDYLLEGDTFTWIFTEPGIYPYHCGIHPDERGTVRVRALSEPSGGPAK